MVLDTVWLLIGLGVLLGGGDVLVRGASALARSFGVSPLAIGLTVLAFGTSAPELAVNLTAAVLDRGELSFGNIIGSNMANVGLVLAATAMLRPLKIDSRVITREAPMMLLACAAAMALGLDRWLSNRAADYDRGEGIALLLFFGVFLYYTLRDMLRQRADAALREATAFGTGQAESRVLSALLTILGLVTLVGGADLTVDSATSLARDLGVSDAVIGLTIVAVGTSLPELTASMMAAYRGHTALAVGNVVGSNIFNLLLILGLSALARPVPVPPGGSLDLVVMGVLALLFWLGSATHRRRINRMEAAGLMSIYFGYMLFRVLLAGPA